MAPITQPDQRQQQTCTHRPECAIALAHRRRLTQGPDHQCVLRWSVTSDMLGAYPILTGHSKTRQIDIQIIAHESLTLFKLMHLQAHSAPGAIR